MIPDWVAEEGLLVCECGKPILINENMTKAKCSDFYCIHHMKHRCDALAKFLGKSGVGPATCEKLLKYSDKATCPFSLLPHWGYKGVELELWEIAKYTFIPGMSNSLRGLCKGHKSFLTVEWPEHLVKYIPDLNASASYCTVKKPIIVQEIKVMMSGRIHGYGSRDQFLRDLNERYAQYCHIVNVGTAFTKADLLIQEPETACTSKHRNATRSGLTIASSEVFVRVLDSIVTAAKTR